MFGSRYLLASAAIAGVVGLSAPAGATFVFDHYWTFQHDAGAGSAAQGSEISAFDSTTKRQFVVGPSGVDILDPATKTLVGTLNTSDPGTGASFGSPNSVAISNGVAAVAFTAPVNTDPGTVAFYDTASGALIRSVTVGATPDMVTFTPDGSRLLVANEGEPNSYNQPGSVDPVGSVSVVNVATGTVQTADFSAFNGQLAALQAQGVRIFGPNASVAQDLEPEYIALSKDGSQAYVTLQENNAMAVVDVATATVTQIIPLGTKDHSLPGNGIDASDRDGPGNDPLNGNIQTWPVQGMYQPDAIGSYQVGGQTYLVMANEGDARDYTGFSEEVRVGAGSYQLDPTLFPNAAALKDNDNLGRLNVTSATGDTDGDGDFDAINVFGARSFSIRTADGTIVFDSGDMIEQIIKADYPALWDDTRSDNKGPEPEGLTIVELFGHTLLFLGLERTNAVMVFDISDPNSPLFITLLFNIGDLGPEGLDFIYAATSFDGKNYLVITNEVSATTTFIQVSQVPAPPALTLLALGLGGLGALRRRMRR